MKNLFAFLFAFLPLLSIAQNAPFGNLSAPADNDSCQTTTVTLCANVTDVNGDSVLVRFYFRPSMNAPRDFTLMGLPDTQYYTSLLNNGTNEMFKAQTAWIVAHKDSLNIAHVCHFGDCVQNGDYNGDPTEWERADTAMRLIEDPLTTNLPDGISYTMSVGNHDQWPTGDPNGTTTFFNQYFSENRFSGRGYWGGNYDTLADNSFQLFSASGYDFIVVSLEYDPSANASVLAWADSLLQAYPSRRAIIVSHYLIDAIGAFGPQGALTYQALRHNPNLCLMLCGHVSAESKRRSIYNGDTTYTILADYQSRPFGGGGLMRIMTFSPELNTLNVKTYSPVTNTFENDTNSAFFLPMTLYPQTTYAAVDSAYVDSAGNVCVTIPNLAANTAYDWYATADDGTHVTILGYSRFATFGSVVSMSVSTDTVCQNAPPVLLTGNPAGGIFSGNGVSGNTMDPFLAPSGMNTVTYAYVNAAGCANTASSGVFIDPCLGINTADVPANSVNFLDGKLLVQSNSAAEIFLYDVLGNVVVSANCFPGTTTINLSCAGGIYFYRLTTENSCSSGKFFINDTK